VSVAVALSPCCHRLSALTWPRSFMREWTGCSIHIFATTSTSADQLHSTVCACCDMAFCSVAFNIIIYACEYMYYQSIFEAFRPLDCSRLPWYDGKYIHLEGYRQLYWTADIDYFCSVMFWHSRIVFIWSLQKFTSLVWSFKTLGSYFQPNFRN